MQVPGLFDIPDKRGKFGLVHNIGLGGAVVVSLLRRPEFFKAGGTDGRARCMISLVSWEGRRSSKGSIDWATITLASVGPSHSRT